MAASRLSPEQIDWLDKAIKIVLGLAGLVGIGAGIVRKLRARRHRREQEYGDRIERIARHAFKKELEDLSQACELTAQGKEQWTQNREAIERIENWIHDRVDEGDKTYGLVLRIVSEIAATTGEQQARLDDLQAFIDHAHKIDRRAAPQVDRRQRVADMLETAQEQRHERRRSSDRERRDG